MILLLKEVIKPDISTSKTEDRSQTDSWLKRGQSGSESLPPITGTTIVLSYALAGRKVRLESRKRKTVSPTPQYRTINSRVGLAGSIPVNRDHGTPLNQLSPSVLVRPVNRSAAFLLLSLFHSRRHTGSPPDTDAVAGTLPYL